jgi:RimJ/RimL family protein N-acetyltransferase
MSEHAPAGPAYRIETARLVIRCWSPADAPLLKSAIDASLSHLRPWMPWAEQEPQPLPEKVARLRRMRAQFDLGEDFVYGVFAAGEAEVVGGTGLHTRAGSHAREIGYWIAAAHVGRGYATEVAAALTRVGFEIDQLKRVEIRVAPDNTRSLAVPRKLGFVHEATLRERFDLGNGQLRDQCVFSLFARDYPASPAAQAGLRAYDCCGARIL